MESYTLGKHNTTFISCNGNFIDDRGAIDKSLYENVTHKDHAFYSYEYQLFDLWSFSQKNKS